MKLEWMAVKGGKLGKKVVSPYITARGAGCVWRIMNVQSAAYDGEGYIVYMCADLDVELGDQLAWGQFRQVMPLGIVYYRLIDRAQKTVQLMEDGIDTLLSMLPDEEEESDEGEGEE